MVSLELVKKIYKNEFITKIIHSFLGKGSYTLFTMLFSLVCTRLYGAEGFGEFTYAFTLVTLLMVFAKAGLDNGLIFHIPRYENRHVSFSFLVNLILSIALILISYLFIEDQFIKWMLPLVWLVSMEQIFFGIYRATGQIKEFYFINGFISILLRIILVLAFYYIIGDHVLGIALAVYISFIFSNGIYFYQHRSRFQKIEYDKDFLKYSFPLVLAASMGLFMDKIDIIMIGSMLDKKSVGIYQIAAQVAAVLTFILIIFNTVFAPKISQMYHEGKLDDLRDLYIRSTRILGLLSLLITIMLALLSKYILLIFGSEIVDGQWALIIRSIGQFFNVAVGSVWLMIAMTGRPKLQMYGVTIAFIINLILNYLLIPVYGINGAAFASMVAVAFSNILGYILVSRIFKVKVYKIV